MDAAVLWQPPEDVFTSTEMGRFAARNGFDGFEALQRWSVTDLEGFGRAVWDFYELVLFVVAELDDDLRARLAGALRTQLSPRHVPDTIAAVPAIPRTLTQKKLEAPVKRILRGAPAESVASRGALADPRAIDAFVEFSEGREK